MKKAAVAVAGALSALAVAAAWEWIYAEAPHHAPLRMPRLPPGEELPVMHPLRVANRARIRAEMAADRAEVASDASLSRMHEQIDNVRAALVLGILPQRGSQARTVDTTGFRGVFGAPVLRDW